MKVHLTSAYPYHATTNFAAKWLAESAELDPFGIHSVTEDPEEADLILFTEHHPPYDPYFFEVFRSKTYRRFRNKCFLYHDCDWAVPVIPGVYPSVEKKIFKDNVMASGHYIARLCTNESVKAWKERPEPQFLFSFIGAKNTHRIRKVIFNKLEHADGFLKDTSGKHSWTMDRQEKIRFEEEYVGVSQKSRFVLCPRGVGPSTYRLFETMEMGIVPVIISDDWVPIEGPDWEAFSIRIPEEQVEQVPSVLEANKHRAPKMGRLARLAWEEWFSKEVSFHHLTEACRRIQQRQHLLPKGERIKIYGQFFRPFHFQNLLRYGKRRLLN